jgi:hypothetical protein
VDSFALVDAEITMVMASLSGSAKRAPPDKHRRARGLTRGSKGAPRVGAQPHQKRSTSSKMAPVAQKPVLKRDRLVSEDHRRTAAIQQETGGATLEPPVKKTGRAVSAPPVSDAITIADRIRQAAEGDGDAGEDQGARTGA